MELGDLSVALLPGPTQLSIACSTWGDPRNKVTLRVYLTTKYPQESREHADSVINHEFAFEAEYKQTGLASLANRYMYSLIPRPPPFVCYSSVCVHNNHSVTMIHCPLTELYAPFKRQTYTYLLFNRLYYIVGASSKL